MVLKRCRECDGQVSARARACPHCGAPGPAASTMGRAEALLAFMVALAFYVASSIFLASGITGLLDGFEFLWWVFLWGPALSFLLGLGLTFLVSPRVRRWVGASKEVRAEHARRSYRTDSPLCRRCGHLASYHVPACSVDICDCERAEELWVAD